MTLIPEKEKEEEGEEEDEEPKRWRDLRWVWRASELAIFTAPSCPNRFPMKQINNLTAQHQPPRVLKMLEANTKTKKNEENREQTDVTIAGRERKCTNGNIRLSHKCRNEIPEYIIYIHTQYIYIRGKGPGTGRRV